MKKYIKYLFSIIIITIATYFAVNVSEALAIGLIQHYKADRGPYTGSLYFDSLVWSSAMFCNQHGGPYFNGAATVINVSGTVDGKNVSVNFSGGGGTQYLRSEYHANCFYGTASLTLKAVSYPGIGNGAISGECGATTVSIPGTVYGTGEIYYKEDSAQTAKNDETAYLLAEANANTPGIVPKSSYPNQAWWRRNEAAAAANAGKNTIFDDDPTLSESQEAEVKEAIIGKNQTQIDKLNTEKSKLEKNIKNWNKTITKYENKISEYEENIEDFKKEIKENNELINKKKNQKKNNETKLNDAQKQLNAKIEERNNLKNQGKDTQKVNKEISTLSSQIQGYKDANEGLDADIAILENENAELETQINKYQKLIDAIVNPQTTKQYNSSIPKYQSSIKKAQKRITAINKEIADLQEEIKELNEYFKNRLQDREKFMKYLDEVAVRKNVNTDGYSAGDADGLVNEARLFATMHKTIATYGKNGKNGKYQNTVKDLTNTEKVEVTYDATRRRYLVGPFKIQYMEVYSPTSYGESDSSNKGNQFAGITGTPVLSVQVYKDGKNQIEDLELGDGWIFSWEAQDRKSTDTLGGSIPEQYDAYPHTGEEFYILIDYKEGMHEIGGLTFDFRCLTAEGTYHYSQGSIEKKSWTAGNVSFTKCNYESWHSYIDDNGIEQYYATYCSKYRNASITIKASTVGSIETQELMRVELANREFTEIKVGYGYTDEGNLEDNSGKARFKWNIDLTTTMAGDVWVDGKTQKDSNTELTMGIKENGEKKLANIGVTVYIYSGSRNVKKAIAYGADGKQISWPVYTNSKGHYEISRLEAPGNVKNGFYVIEFEYDGQVYKQTSYLGEPSSSTVIDGQTYANKGTAITYKEDPNKYINSSMAIEQIDTRVSFDTTFGEITGTKEIGDDYSTTGKTNTTDIDGTNARENDDKKFNTINYSGTTVDISGKNGGTQVVSELNSASSLTESKTNLKVSEGEKYDRYRMTAKTYYDNTELHGMSVTKSYYRIKYPLVEEKDENGKSQDWIYIMNRYKIKNEKGVVTGRYIDNYMLHINLGLEERPKTDMSTLKDLYKVTLVVNEQKITKQYNLLGDFETSEYQLALEKRQAEWQGKKYTKYSVGLYSTDLAYQSYQRYKNAIKEVQNIKKGTELRLFVTYVVRVYNNSETNNVELNEITDYYDGTYTIVSEDIKTSIVDNNSKRSQEVVADAPYYRIMNTSAAQTNNLWGETKAQNLEGKVDGVNCGRVIWSNKKDTVLDSQNMLKSTTKSLTSIKIKPNQYAEIFTTYEVDKEGYEKMQNNTATIKDRKLIIGDKENIAEISNYSTYYTTKDIQKNHYRTYRDGWISGKVDQDSAPNNIKKSNIKSRTKYEDDTDRSIPINIKLETYEREMYGYVWEDAKNSNAGKYNIKTGDGYYGTGDKLVGNVGITMYEVINMGRLNKDGSYNTEYDSYDYYYQIPQDYYNYNSLKSAYSITTGEKANTTAVESKKSLIENVEGNYYIYGFLPGDYILRFDYGTKGTGEKEIIYSTSEDGNIIENEKSIIKYNGQDYENTKFLGNLSEKTGVEHLNDKYLDLTGNTKIDKKAINDLKISTARDNESRRMIVDAYSRTIENDRAEILRNRDASDTEFIDATKMYAETPIMQIEIEDPRKIKVRDENGTSTKSDQEIKMRINGEKYEPDAKKNQVEENKYAIKNINFGIEERAKTDISLEKYIENIQLLKADEIILNATMTEDGEIIKSDVNAAGLDKIAYLPHTKASTTGLYQQGFYTLSIEDDFLKDITIRIQYKIKILNNSEADFTGKLSDLYKAEEIIKKAKEYNEYQGKMTPKVGTEYNTSTIKPQIIEYGKYVGRFYYENRIKEKAATYKISKYADDNSALDAVDIKYSADKPVTTTVDQLIEYIDIDASLENDSSIANAAWLSSGLGKEADGYNTSLKGLISKTAYRTQSGNLNIYDEKDREFINDTRSNIAISYNERLHPLKETQNSNDKTVNCEARGRVEYEENDKTRSKYNSTLTKELKPKIIAGEESDEYYSEISVTVRKVATEGINLNQMRIDNLAEVLVYSNSIGRKDKNSVPGNAMTISTKQGMWKAGYNSIEYWKNQAGYSEKDWTNYPENDAWSPEFVTLITPTGIAERVYIKKNIIPIVILIISMATLGGIFVIKQKNIHRKYE